MAVEAGVPAPDGVVWLVQWVRPRRVVFSESVVPPAAKSDQSVPEAMWTKKAGSMREVRLHGYSTVDPGYRDSRAMN
eukprot:COSAG02_NODE_6936_length_3279_cov_21.396388_6_plen_76_part_01